MGLKSSFSLDYIEAGIDEAGRGSLIGAVFSAAVILPKDYSHILLKDSKKLNEKQRNQLRLEIEKEAIDYSVAQASHQEIDRYNILQATFLSMHRAIEGLKQNPELLLIDGNRFIPYQFIPYHCIIKGDNTYLSIAAASILAKTYRDESISKLATQYPEYEWDKNMGYGTLKHRKAIEAYGYTPWHRKSFKLKSVVIEKE